MKKTSHQTLISKNIQTPLGSMLAVSDDVALYLLDFVDGRGADREIEKLQVKKKVEMASGNAFPIASIERELHLYFEGKLTEFKTSIHCEGTPFQQRVWKALQKIPYGETRSYLDQAKAIQQKTACRAVANANGKNRFVILIPCHRVINNNGALGGYGGGLTRKQWLLAHEKPARG